MFIYLDENDYVYGYGSQPTEKSFEVEELPEDILENLGSYKYIDNEFVLDEEKRNHTLSFKEMQSELYQLEEWFKWYDQQVIQYQRAMRLGIEFDKDINELDAQAVETAARIKELRAFMGTPYSE